MKNLYSLCTLIIILSLSSFSQGIDNENLVITHGPYLQNMGTSGVTIIWTTNKPAVPGVSLTCPDGKVRFVRNSRDGIIDGGGLLHKVRIDGLDAGNTYKYSINSIQILKYQAYKIYYGDTINMRSESFTTPQLKSETINFTVVNDVHGNAGKLASYIKNGNVSAQDFFFFNGDMIDYVQSPDQLFTGFIDTAVTYFGMRKPFFYARGNHEARGYAGREFKNYFDFKENRFYYSFDNGPVHFTVLDCGEDKPDNNRYYYGLADYDSYRLEELEWLKNEVKSDAFRNAKYRIVIVHMPIVKEIRQSHGQKFLADNFGPVLMSAGINLMISGHTHRNTYYEKGKSGFGYPVLVNSANSFVEVYVDNKIIKTLVKDINGGLIAEYELK